MFQEIKLLLRNSDFVRSTILFYNKLFASKCLFQKYESYKFRRKWPAGPYWAARALARPYWAERGSLVREV